jgi:hypothetical protein
MEPGLTAEVPTTDSRQPEKKERLSFLINLIVSIATIVSVFFSVFIYF